MKLKLEINGKTLLAALALSGSVVFANYVSLVDAKSAGGIVVEESAVPVGSIQMWGTATPPDGWIEIKGQSTAAYPELAKLYPGNLPDFRGQFIRAWDNGAGVDSGRSLLTTQGDATLNASGSAGISGGSSYGAVWSGSGPFGVSGSASGHLQGANTSYNAYRTLTFDLKKAIGADNIANEIRPKNISVMYIIKAE